MRHKNWFLCKRSKLRLSMTIKKPIEN